MKRVFDFSALLCALCASALKLAVAFCSSRRRELANLPDVKQIKLSGREQAVLRAIGFGAGCTGAEIHEQTQIDPSDLAEILNGLCDAGYAEMFPAVQQVTAAECPTTRFEINPAYALHLKTALRRN